MKSTHGFLQHAHTQPWNATKVSWLQSSQACTDTVLDADACSAEALHAMIVIIVLCSTIFLMFCAFYFFREDKEEQITPLSPQMVVRDGDFKFMLPLDQKLDCMAVSDKDGNAMCKVVMDWPDPFRPGASGVTATVRLQSCQDQTLATVVARSLAVVGQGLALCRAGCEIFGFVEADGLQRYHVRHRTGVHLLTLTGDFDNIDITGVNPVGSKVCWLKKEENGDCRGGILQHVDAGLVICALLATNVHRRLHSDRRPQPKPMIKEAEAVDAENESATADGEVDKSESASVAHSDSDGEAAQDSQPVVESLEEIQK